MEHDEETIAIYSRKSRFTGKGESIGNQIELCRGYIRAVYGEKSAERCVVFEDEGFSGGNLKRPAFQNMMAAVRKGKFRAIVVYRLDRISRNISDFTGLIDELTRLGVSFVSIREQFDTSTPMGRAMMFIISVFSQLERETIAERIRDNMQELAKTGRWLGGNAPTGFRSQTVSRVTVDGKSRRSCRLILIPEEAEIPKLVFDLYSRTDSLTAVEAELLRRRVKTKRGGDFSRFAIKGILQNPVYLVGDEAAYTYFMEREAEVCCPREAFDGSRGIMAYNRTDQEKGRATALLPVNRWIIALGEHPGLIPSGQWIRVQASLERNKSKAYGKPRTNAALLTGLLFCACGERMYPKLSRRTTAAGDSVYSYVCKRKERSRREQCNRANADGNGLDGAVFRRIQTLEEQNERLVAQLEKLRARMEGCPEPRELQLGMLRRELGEKERLVEGLVDSLCAAEESAAKMPILQRIETLNRETGEIREKICELEETVPAPPADGDAFDRLRRELASPAAALDSLSLEGKRWAVRSVVRKVIWDGKTADVMLVGSESQGEG